MSCGFIILLLGSVRIWNLQETANILQVPTNGRMLFPKTTSNHLSSWFEKNFLVCRSLGIWTNQTILLSVFLIAETSLLLRACFSSPSFFMWNGNLWGRNVLRSRRYCVLFLTASLPLIPASHLTFLLVSLTPIQVSKVKTQSAHLNRYVLFKALGIQLLSFASCSQAWPGNLLNLSSCRLKEKVMILHDVEYLLMSDGCINICWSLQQNPDLQHPLGYLAIYNMNHHISNYVQEKNSRD